MSKIKHDGLTRTGQVYPHGNSRRQRVKAVYNYESGKLKVDITLSFIELDDVCSIKLRVFINDLRNGLPLPAMPQLWDNLGGLQLLPYLHLSTAFKSIIKSCTENRDHIY